MKSLTANAGSSPAENKNQTQRNSESWSGTAPGPEATAPTSKPTTDHSTSKQQRKAHAKNLQQKPHRQSMQRHQQLRQNLANQGIHPQTRPDHTNQTKLLVPRAIPTNHEMAPEQETTSDIRHYIISAFAVISILNFLLLILVLQK